VPGEVISLGARLRQRREELGLSQAQAARELDVARTAYRLWEMEAARPAPDRWRAIAGWLGITVTALLRTAELLDQEEARQAEQVARAAGMTVPDLDAQSASSEGDSFLQERAMIADRASAGSITGDQASSLRRLLERIEQVASSDHQRGSWFPARLHKRLTNTDLAPTVARAALAATAVGIPASVLRDATVLTSELVTNSVTHARTSAIDLDITLDAERLRIEVGDSDSEVLRPRTPDTDGGWGLMLIAQLATRWGVDRHTGGKRVWIEFDLGRPSDTEPS
jgi:transcriptional regulator with XRE-family HTH domain/anti-sigma regulatory factor (Ser/Thr protein kinase)